MNHCNTVGQFGQRTYLLENEKETLSETLSEAVRTVRTCPNCPKPSDPVSDNFRTSKRTEHQRDMAFVRNVRRVAASFSGRHYHLFAPRPVPDGIPIGQLLAMAKAERNARQYGRGYAPGQQLDLFTEVGRMAG